MRLRYLDGYSANDTYLIAPSACGGAIEVQRDGPHREPQEGKNPDYYLRQSIELRSLLGCGPEASARVTATPATKLVSGPELEWWLQLEALSSRADQLGAYDLLLLGPFPTQGTLGEALLWRGHRFPTALLAQTRLINARGIELHNLQAALDVSRPANPGLAANRFLDCLINNPKQPTVTAELLCTAIAYSEEQPHASKAGRRAFLKLLSNQQLSAEEIIKAVDNIHPRNAALLAENGSSISLQKWKTRGNPFPPKLLVKIQEGWKPNLAAFDPQAYLNNVVAWEANHGGGAASQQQLLTLFGENPPNTAAAELWMRCHHRDGIPDIWVNNHGIQIFWQLVRQYPKSDDCRRVILPLLQTPAALAALAHTNPQDPAYLVLNENIASMV